MASPEAKALIRADDRKLNSDLSKAKSKFKKSFSSIGRGIKSTLGGALSPLGVGLSIGGAAAIGKEVIEFEKSLQAVINQADGSGQSIDELRSSVTAFSRETGKSREQILSATKGLIDLEGATINTESRAVALQRAAVATGARFEDLAGVAFALENAFGISSGEDLERTLDSIVKIGKKGSIPLEKLAPLLRQTASGFSKVSKSGQDGAAQLSAFLQVAATGDFGSEAEISTGLQRFTDNLKKNQDLIQRKLKIKVFEIDGDEQSMRPIADILEELGNSRIVRDEKLLGEIFNQTPARKFAEVMLKSADRVAELEAVAGTAAGTIATDFQNNITNPAAKAEIALNNAKLALSKAFTPERIEMVARLLEQVADAVGFAVDHAQNLAIAFAGIKLAGLTTQLNAVLKLSAAAGVSTAKVAEETGKATANAGKMVGTLGKINSAVGVISVGLAAWQIGTMLDQWLKISDTIAGLAIDERSLAEDQTGFLRDRVSDLGAATSEGRTDLSQEESRDVEGLLREAKNLGIIGPGGRIDKVKAFEAASGREATSFGFASPLLQTTKDQNFEGSQGFLGQENVSKAQNLIKTLELAQRANREQKISVDVTVDERGLLRAKQREEANARKGSQ